MTITDFLLARIADDKEDANEAAQEIGSDGWDRWARETYSPRLLAECSAKRRIVELHPIYRGPRILGVGIGAFDYGCEKCHCIDPIHEDGIIEAAGECETLLALASVYADHADYDPAWR